MYSVKLKPKPQNANLNPTLPLPLTLTLPLPPQAGASIAQGVPGAENSIVAVAAGGTHSAFVTKDGKLYVSGDDSHSQRGASKGAEYWGASQVDLPGDVVEVP